MRRPAVLKHTLPIINNNCRYFCSAKQNNYCQAKGGAEPRPTWIRLGPKTSPHCAINKKCWAEFMLGKSYFQIQFVRFGLKKKKR